MLGDSILVLIGMLLIVMGVQPMLETSTRKNSVAIVNSMILVLMGIFIVFYWNSIVPS
jgi:hypothetical protein